MRTPELCLQFVELWAPGLACHRSPYRKRSALNNLSYLGLCTLFCAGGQHSCLAQRTSLDAENPGQDSAIFVHSVKFLKF